MAVAGWISGINIGPFFDMKKKVYIQMRIINEDFNKKKKSLF